ncbi:hypothetical protein PM02_09105 [Sulfitobacter mediterraneus]|uniref:Uncharacterized protein n=1 Tax=Sulfitobacter mediterraneus TaxID=83219 RepID=A0A061SV87_9RHOB|nr:hypothetical protein PM02_09105 [Sulfitobacter mediterraneus]
MGSVARAAAPPAAAARGIHRGASIGQDLGHRVIGKVIPVAAEQNPKAGDRILPCRQRQRPVEKDRPAFRCRNSIHAIRFENQAFGVHFITFFHVASLAWFVGGTGRAVSIISAAAA